MCMYINSLVINNLIFLNIHACSFTFLKEEEVKGLGNDSAYFPYMINCKSSLYYIHVINLHEQIIFSRILNDSPGST